MNFEQKIFELINSKREGDYWDFKEEPHENNASLLHDILCLSNSLYQGNKYLIYGVSDPAAGANITGLSAGQANRKQQINFVDFLRTKKFAGDIRPEIELKTIIINGKEVDILVIFDSSNKPFYITEDYRDRNINVMAFHIYSRINDSNTPINKSADLYIVEKIWKHRFGLDLSPLDRIKLLLKTPSQWFKNIGNKKVAYHIQQPEFTIEFSDVREFWEPYTLFYTNERAFLGTASFKYHGTVLFELEYMYCDEMRIALPVPETAYIRLSNSEKWLFYYELNQLSGIFLYFLKDGTINFESRGSFAPFIVFKNKEWHDEFIDQVKDREKEVLEIEPDYWSQQVKKKMSGDKQSVIDPLFLSQAYQFYNEFVKKKM